MNGSVEFRSAGLERDGTFGQCDGQMRLEMHRFEVEADQECVKTRCESAEKQRAGLRLRMRIVEFGFH